MTPKLITVALLTLAVLLAWARLFVWQAKAGAARSTGWRLAIFVVLQPAIATFLFLALYPPAIAVGEDTLVIATADTPSSRAQRPGGRLIALPEARGIAGAQAFPDLGSALRRYPTARRIGVLGRGLGPRDVDAARGLSVKYAPPPDRAGIISTTPPPTVAPGSSFPITGTAKAPQGAEVELVDPAGRVTDQQPVGPDGRFALSGTARAAGMVEFVLRLRGARGTLIEEGVVPLAIADPVKPRLLILAGAPGAEVKYLRRWASDAGFIVNAQISVGGGIALGDPPIALSADALRKFDVAIVDPRAWASLGGGRGVLVNAVKEGMGLLLRADGDEESRALWRSLGLQLQGGGGLKPVTLPGDAARSQEASAMMRTRVGIGSRDVPAELNVEDAYLPEVSQVAGTWGGAEVVPFLNDAAGRPLAAWYPLGLGRVAAFSVVDSYALALAGKADLFASWWSSALSTVSRPADRSAPFEGMFWAGERAALCTPASPARVEQPDGRTVDLVGDAGSGGCSAFWPVQPGWHRVVWGAGQAQGARSFYVYAAEAYPIMRAMRDRDATLRLTTSGAAAPFKAGEMTEQSGSPWPWFALLLLAGVVLWAFERQTIGRQSSRKADGKVEAL